MAIFITGASGYIGGAVAKGFADAGYAVRGLVRTDAAADALKALGVEPVLGTLEDHDLLAHEARAAEAVIHAARAEDPVSAAVLTDALQGSGKRFIQTSGTGIVARPTCGNALYPTVFDDEGMTITSAPGREARLQIDWDVRAAAQTGVHSIIICPPAIYGYSRGPRRASMQVLRLLDHVAEHGVVTIIGEGRNSWSQIHIDDLVDLFLLAYRDAPAGSFYFAENGEASFGEIAQALEDRLHLGSIKSISIEQAEPTWRAAQFVFGGNSRVSAKRARRELGWSPSRPKVLQWIGSELELDGAGS